MRLLAGVFGAALLAVVLWDAFETVVLPRRISRRFRLTRLFYRATWQPFSLVVRRVRSVNRREAVLSFFGPLSLLLLIGLWAGGLVRDAVARVGALGGRAARDPPLLSAPRLFPLAAHQRVLAVGADHAPRRERAAHRHRRRGRVRPPGAAHVRDGAARGGRPVA